MAAGSTGSDDLAPLKRTLGDLLASYRAAAGLTQQELARRIGYARVTVATAESGHRQPAAEFWTRCEDVLSARGELSRAYEQLAAVRDHRRRELARREQAGRTARAAAWRLAQPPEDGVYAQLAVGRDRRRKQLTAQDQARRAARSGLRPGDDGADVVPVSDAEDWLARSPGAVGGQLASVGDRWELSGRRRFRSTPKLVEEDVDPITRRYRSLYHRLPSADLLPAVLGHLRLVGGLLGGADDQTRRRLASTVAETAGFAAWLSADLGDGVGMLRLYRMADRAVAESGDRVLGGYIRGFQAQILAGRGEYLRAVGEARAARDQVGRSASSVVLAWLAAVHAKALACAGRPVEAQDALSDAEGRLDRGSGAERPEWMYDFDRPRFTAYAGACYLRVARPTEAEQVLREALTGLPATDGRRGAEVSVDLAHALLEVGQVDEAIALAGAAAETFGAWDSVSGLSRVDAFARRLGKKGHVAAAGSLTERVLAYTATP